MGEEMTDEIERLTAERDETRRQRNNLRAQVSRTIGERDRARAEVERLKGEQTPRRVLPLHHPMCPAPYKCGCGHLTADHGPTGCLVMGCGCTRLKEGPVEIPAYHIEALEQEVERLRAGQDSLTVVIRGANNILDSYGLASKDSSLWDRVFVTCQKLEVDLAEHKRCLRHLYEKAVEYEAHSSSNAHCQAYKCGLLIALDKAEAVLEVKDEQDG